LNLYDIIEKRPAFLRKQALHTKQSLCHYDMARLRAGQASFYGRYPPTLHTAGFLARASLPAAPSRFRNGVCGGFLAYSDRIAQVFHLIPYYLPPSENAEALNVGIYFSTICIIYRLCFACQPWITAVSWNRIKPPRSPSFWRAGQYASTESCAPIPRRSGKKAFTPFFLEKMAGAGQSSAAARVGPFTKAPQKH